VEPIYERGYRGTSLPAIASGGGSSQMSSLFYLYASKEDFLMAAIALQARRSVPLAS
jgi:hypothetical protein